MIQLTPSDLRATIGAGMTLSAAARMLRCANGDVRRAINAYAFDYDPICLNSKQHGGFRRMKITSAEAWRAIVAAYGPGLRKVARAVDMDHRWVAKQLERHGIDPGFGKPGRPWPQKAA